jgi:hypothetical protein
MPRRHRNRTMKGGFLDTLSEWSSSISQGASNLWQKTKDATSNLTGTSQSTQYTTSSSILPTTTSTTPTYGGKTRRRRMKGGFHDNISTTNLASNAAPFSGPTAKPHDLVGGKSRKNKRKSRKHRKH